jgi:hypothetical protein
MIAATSADDNLARLGKLLSTSRLRASRVKDRSELDARSEFENDFDRVIFSSSFRRLRNKAQVFSLDSHDFVRTRLTHSIEVSTIGRSLGEGSATGLVRAYPKWNYPVVCLDPSVAPPPPPLGQAKWSQ